MRGPLRKHLPGGAERFHLQHDLAEWDGQHLGAGDQHKIPTITKAAFQPPKCLPQTTLGAIPGHGPPEPSPGGNADPPASVGRPDKEHERIPGKPAAFPIDPAEL